MYVCMYIYIGIVHVMTPHVLYIWAVVFYSDENEGHYLYLFTLACFFDWQTKTYLRYDTIRYD